MPCEAPLATSARRVWFGWVASSLLKSKSSCSLLASRGVGDVQVGSDAQPLALPLLVKVKAVHIPWSAHLRVSAADSLVTPTVFFVGDADIQAD